MRSMASRKKRHVPLDTTMKASDHLPPRLTPLPQEFAIMNAPTLLLTETTGAEAAQRQRLVAWISDFLERSSGLQRIVVLETMLRRVTAATAKMPPPCDMRTAACMMILESLEGVVDIAAAPLLRILYDEIATALFLPARQQPPTDVYVAAKLGGMGLNMQEVVRMQQLLARRTYADAFRELSASLQESLTSSRHLQFQVTRRSHCVMRVLLRWHLSFLRIVFTLWRGVSRRTHIHRRAASRFVERLKQKDLMQTVFFTWRESTLRHRLVEQRLHFNELLQTIATKEASAVSHANEWEERACTLESVMARVKAQAATSNEAVVAMQRLSDECVEESEQWRVATISSLRLLQRVNDITISRRRIDSSKDLVADLDAASKILLHWVATILKPLRKRDRIKVSSIATDFRDGKAYLCILHVLTKGNVSLDHNNSSDVDGRMTLLLDTLSTMSIHLTLTVEELSQGSLEVTILVLFALWWHHYNAPLIPDELTVTGSFRRDFETVQQHLNVCEEVFPRWMEHRVLLQNVVMYILTARTRGKALKQLSVDSDRETQKLTQNFHLRRAKYCFLSEVTSSKVEGLVKDLNEAIVKHLSVLKSITHTFALTGADDEATVFIAYDQWYQLCRRLRLLGSTAAYNEVASRRKKSKEFNCFTSPNSMCFPLTKVALHQMFERALTDNSNSSGPLPADFGTPSAPVIVLLIILAQHRYRVESLGNAFDALMSSVVTPRLLRDAPSPFHIELGDESVQRKFLERRGLLNALFTEYSRTPGLITGEDVVDAMCASGADGIVPSTSLVEVVRHFGYSSSWFRDSDEENATTVADVVDTPLSAVELLYPEFEEAFAILSVYVYPSLVTPLSTKVTRLLARLETTMREVAHYHAA